MRTSSCTSTYHQPFRTSCIAHTSLRSDAILRNTVSLLTYSAYSSHERSRSISCGIRCQDTGQSSSVSERSNVGIGRGRILRALSGTILAPLLKFRWPSKAESMAAEIAPPPPGQASMRTLHDSELAVAIYPTFNYNAVGGGGLAKAEQDGDVVHLTFDPTTLVIPDVNYRNTTFMGVPMAPPFSIAVKPRKLEGFVDRRTGRAELTFLADFMFTAGPLYKAPPLVVTTLLTTESVQGDVQGGTGKRMDEQGFAKLVGVARLDPTKDVLLDKFLMLPNDCKAVMSCQFAFNPSAARYNNYMPID